CQSGLHRATLFLQTLNARCRTISPMPRIDAHTHVFAPWQVENREALCTRDETFREIYADP
ncbi:MAG TPA: hypothetical protein VN697_11620, partial [Tepidiformaceae bacterium]|nr:hypothetical protein [Tepidiformaceae bacterium]